MKRNELYSKAVSTYGINAQEDVLLEEMAELSKVILKGRRGQLSTKDLTDEIADVEIMLEQMKQHFGIGDEVKARKRFKKERLGKRLDVEDKIGKDIQVLIKPTVMLHEGTLITLEEIKNYEVKK